MIVIIGIHISVNTIKVMNSIQYPSYCSLYQNQYYHKPPTQYLSIKQLILDTLDKTSKFSINDKIPHFHETLSIMDSIFVNKTGSASLLITNYYMFEKSQDEPFTYDIIEQSSWCIKNIPCFGVLAKGFINIRNNIIDKIPLKFTVFKKIINDILLFSEEKTKFYYIVDELVKQISLVCNIMLSGSSKRGIEFCMLCESGFPIISKTDHNLQNNVLDNLTTETVKETVVTKTFDSSSENTTESITDIYSRPYTLQQLRNSGYREKLKGCKVTILNGNYVDNSGIFKSWAGTAGRINILDVGRTLVALDTLIKVNVT